MAASTREHLRRLRCAAQKKMKVSRETQRMLLDAGALFAAPGGGVRRNTVGEKAVDHAVAEIAQIVAVDCDRDDLLLVWPGR